MLARLAQKLVIYGICYLESDPGLDESCCGRSRITDRHVSHLWPDVARHLRRTVHLRLLQCKSEVIEDKHGNTVAKPLFLFCYEFICLSCFEHLNLRKHSLHLTICHTRSPKNYKLTHPSEDTVDVQSVASEHDASSLFRENEEWAAISNTLF